MSVAPPSFELRLTITGLALFLPQPEKNPTEMHVLMVNPKHHKHYPRLWYDNAHETEDGKLDPNRPRKQKELAGKKLDFKKNLPVVGGTVGVFNPELVPDLRDVTKQIIELAKIPSLGSHLVLPPGTPALTPVSEWDWLGKKRTLVGQIVWSVTVADSHLKAKSERPGLPQLFPKKNGGKDMIDFYISNSIEEESTYPPPQGSAPPPGTPMPHFDTYYDLYPAYSGERPVPLFSRLLTLGNPYSCLPSGGH